MSNHYNNGMDNYMSNQQGYNYNGNLGYPQQGQYARPQPQLQQQQSTSYNRPPPQAPQQAYQEAKRPKAPAPKKVAKQPVKRVKRSKSEEQDSDDDDEGESEVESDPNLNDDVEDYSGDEAVPVATTTKSGRNIIKPKAPVTIVAPPAVKKSNKRKKTVTPEPALEAYAYCCGNPDSLTGNELVLCDQCDKGFHQLCNTPVISTQDLLRDKWYCTACTALRVATFVNLEQMTLPVNLSPENKQDYLATLTPHALVNLILEVESKFGPATTGLPIWPKGLAEEMEKKTLAEIERRRIELLEVEAVEAEYLRGLAAEEERGKAAATLTDLMGMGTNSVVSPVMPASLIAPGGHYQPQPTLPIPVVYQPNPVGTYNQFASGNFNAGGNNLNVGAGASGNGGGVEYGLEFPTADTEALTASELDNLLNGMDQESL